MLKIENIKKTYGDKLKYEALKGINFEVQDGEFVGIMGPSGSGKSTLLNLIATIDEPTSGRIILDGQNPHELKPDELAKFRRRELGFVFQDFNLMPTLTIEENIILPLTLDGERVKTMQRKLGEIAPKLGISELLKKRTAEISGGQAQRVAIARAMIHQPELILADEPTGNLDSKSSKDVMKLLKELNEKERATILMVTHDAFAASYCQRIVFIKDGHLVKEIYNPGNRDDFFDQLLRELRRIEGVEDDI